MTKYSCKECGKNIQQATYDRNQGLCMPCKWNLSTSLPPKELSKEELRIQEYWRNIDLSSKAEILKLRCPVCNIGLELSYGESEELVLKTYMRISCINYQDCGQVIDLDGIDRPEWLNELSMHFRILENGKYISLPENKFLHPDPSFEVGDSVKTSCESEKYSNIEGEISKIKWNFTKSQWDYLITSGGQLIKRRYSEDEVNKNS